MPLIKSPKKAMVGKNIAIEMKAGKPHKQAIAIALSVQRAAKKKKHKMAEGGMASPELAEHAKEELKDLEKLEHEHEEMLSPEELARHEAAEEEEEQRLAEGGMTKEKPVSEDNYQVGTPDSPGAKLTRWMQKKAEAVGDYFKGSEEKKARGGVVDAIRHKQKMMAEGGEVDLQDNEDEHLNKEDDLSYEAARKKTYFDLDQMHEQPEDSNLHGDEREKAEEDEHDMIDIIRRKMKAKR